MVNMILPTLYPHQAEQKDRLRQSIATNRRVILCANPGVGKTRMAKWMLGSAAQKQNGRALFCVHRRGLVDNASDSFSEHPALPHGVIMSGRDPDWSQPVQVGSIDTLLSWMIEDGKYALDAYNFSLIVFDECHSHHSKLQTFLAAHDQIHPPAFVVGLSATPSARGLADTYRDIVTGPSTDWLIENGYLSPYRYVHASQGREGLLVRRGIEFTTDSVCAAMDGLAGDLVEDWFKFGEGRPAVGFFPRISQSQEAARLLAGAGVRVEHVDGDTPDNERREMYQDLAGGRIDYICNVGIIERGTDIPIIQCVQLCLFIGSKVRYRQMIGRGSRVHPEKTDCVIIDHGGNIKRHGFFEDDPPWCLDRSTKEINDSQTRPTIECPECQAIYRGGRCSACGYEPTRQQRRAVGLEFNGSELVEIQRQPKQQTTKSHEAIMVGALYAAANSGRTFRQALAIAYSNAQNCGVKFQVPKRVSIGNRKVEILPYGHPDQSRRVKHIYPFLVRQ